MSSDVNDVSSVFTITFTDFVIAPSFSHLDRVNKIFLVLCFVVMMINDHWSYTHITRILKEFGCQDVSEQEFQSFFNNFRRVWSGNRAVAFSQGGGRGFSFWQRFWEFQIQKFLVNTQTESLYFGKDCIRCHKKSSSSCSEYGTLLFTLSLVLVSEVVPTHSGEGFT